MLFESWILMLMLLLLLLMHSSVHFVQCILSTYIRVDCVCLCMSLNLCYFTIYSCTENCLKTLKIRRNKTSTFQNVKSVWCGGRMVGVWKNCCYQSTKNELRKFGISSEMNFACETKSQVFHYSVWERMSLMSLQFALNLGNEDKTICTHSAESATEREKKRHRNNEWVFI